MALSSKLGLCHLAFSERFWKTNLHRQLHHETSAALARLRVGSPAFLRQQNEAPVGPHPDKKARGTHVGGTFFAGPISCGFFFVDPDPPELLKDGIQTFKHMSLSLT